MGLQQFRENAMNTMIEINKETKDVILTGEKNLILEKTKLIEKVKENEHGEDYMEVMETEHSIFVRQGLFVGYIDPTAKPSGIMFSIPDWDKFISAVHAFWTVCYREGADDGEV